MPWWWPGSAIFSAGTGFCGGSRPRPAWPWSGWASNSPPIAADPLATLGGEITDAPYLTGVIKYGRSPGLRVISRAAGILLSRTGPMRSIRCAREGERAMTKRTVKKIVADSGFGFIAADDGKEYFFHHSGVDTSLNFDSLRGGETVSFDIEQSQKGPRANHVRAA